MIPTAFYIFQYPQPGAKKLQRTTYRMTIETAAERFPGAMPIEYTREMRNLPENDDELYKVSAGNLNVAPKPQNK
jgi:hypothetical protein